MQHLKESRISFRNVLLGVIIGFVTLPFWLMVFAELTELLVVKKLNEEVAGCFIGGDSSFSMRICPSLKSVLPGSIVNLKIYNNIHDFIRVNLSSENSIFYFRVYDMENPNDFIAQGEANPTKNSGDFLKGFSYYGVELNISFRAPTEPGVYDYKIFRKKDKGYPTFYDYDKYQYTEFHITVEENSN